MICRRRLDSDLGGRGIAAGAGKTGSPGIKDDLIRLLALFGEDAPVVIDRHFVSSRKPDDLPEFCKGILKVMAGK